MVLPPCEQALGKRTTGTEKVLKIHHLSCQNCPRSVLETILTTNSHHTVTHPRCISPPKPIFKGPSLPPPGWSKVHSPDWSKVRLELPCYGSLKLRDLYPSHVHCVYFQQNKKKARTKGRKTYTMGFFFPDQMCVYFQSNKKRRGSGKGKRHT